MNRLHKYKRNKRRLSKKYFGGIALGNTVCTKNGMFTLCIDGVIIESWESYYSYL